MKAHVHTKLIHGWSQQDNQNSQYTNQKKDHLYISIYLKCQKKKKNSKFFTERRLVGKKTET